MTADMRTAFVSTVTDLLVEDERVALVLAEISTDRLRYARRDLRRAGGQRRDHGADHDRGRRRVRDGGLPSDRALALAVRVRATVRTAQAGLRLPGARWDLRGGRRLLRLRDRGRDPSRARRRDPDARDPGDGGARAGPRERARGAPARDLCGRASRPTCARASRRTTRRSPSPPGGSRSCVAAPGRRSWRSGRRARGPSVPARGSMSRSPTPRALRPFDTDGLAALAAGTTDVIVVEPSYEASTAPAVMPALAQRPARVAFVGVPRAFAHAYGTPDDLDAELGLDEAGVPPPGGLGVVLSAVPPAGDTSASYRAARPRGR